MWDNGMLRGVDRSWSAMARVILLLLGCFGRLRQRLCDTSCCPSTHLDTSSRCKGVKQSRERRRAAPGTAFGDKL